VAGRIRPFERISDVIGSLTRYLTVSNIVPEPTNHPTVCHNDDIFVFFFIIIIIL
jgi:hypothetical protein